MVELLWVAVVELVEMVWCGLVELVWLSWYGGGVVKMVVMVERKVK